MEKPSIVKEIEKITATELTLVASPEEAMVYKNNAWYYSVDAEENVTGLNLHSRELTDDQVGFLKEMDQSLWSLQALNLSENRLTQFDFIWQMGAMRMVDLSQNKSIKTISFECGLPFLEKLDLSENQIGNLNIPKGFEGLKTLDLRKNELANIVFEEDCPALVSLDLSENQLKELSLPAGFGALKYVYLNDNELKHVSFASAMPELKTLHLRKNKLEALPPNLLSFAKLETLYLYDNPLPNIPKETIASGERENSWENIRNYLFAAKKSALIPLYQAKMILVGNGEVGKTSIRIKLLDKKAALPKKGDRTPGLDIQPYIVRDISPTITKLEKPIDFQLNIWDFGGQGKYREVQQLFCSRKSLYLFVTSYDDNREKDDYIGFEYWLSMVNAYSYDPSEGRISPVIHIVNKIDLETVLIDENKRFELFPNIHKEFIKISCEEPLQNFDLLEKTIRNVLPNVSRDIFTSQYTENWLSVKSELEKRQKENHLSYAEYERICLKDDKMEVGEARTWIEILDRIGAVIYFSKHPELKDWIVLNPQWAKDALVNVLNSTSVDNGVLKPKHFPEIWPGYAPDEHARLIALMVAYKLCYEDRNEFGETQYVVPALLNDKKPNLPSHLQNPTRLVRFEFDPIIPAGTVNKLMVYFHNPEIKAYRSGEEFLRIEKDMPQVHTTVYNNLIWKNNLILHDPLNNAYAHIREVWEEKVVYISLFGKEVEPIFSHISEMIRIINQTLKDTKYMDRLDLRAMGWHKEAWWALDGLQKLGIDFFSKSKQSSSMDRVQHLIAQGYLEEALNALYEAIQHSDVVQLQARLKKLERDERMGVISHADAGIERNKIIDAALAINGMASAAPVKSPKQSKPTTPAGEWKAFISYARKEDNRYLKLFAEGIKAHSNWEVFDDRQIMIGEDWHERLQKEVQICDFGILLLSPHFFKSEYIKKNEFEEFLARTRNSGFPIFSVLLVACDYTQWSEIAKRQFFVAHGQEYDLAKNYRDKQITFGQLVRFDNDGEVLPNDYRDQFFMNFVAAVEKAMNER